MDIPLPEENPFPGYKKFSFEVIPWVGFGVLHAGYLPDSAIWEIEKIINKHRN